MYFFGDFTCASEVGVVRAAPSAGGADWLFDEIEPSEECLQVEGRARIQGQAGDPVVDVFTELLPNYEYHSVFLPCTHVLSDAIPGGATRCEGEAQASIIYWETGGGGGSGAAKIFFEADLASLGDAFGTSAADDASVTVQCEGDSIDVPIGGLPVSVLVGLDFGSCTVTMSQVAEVASAGNHTRILSVRLKGDEFRCLSSYQCAASFPVEAPICGTSGLCQDGDEGDPCWSDLHCEQPANYCGPDFQCHDGSSGDSCFLETQCQAGLSCVSGLCTP